MPPAPPARLPTGALTCALLCAMVASLLVATAPVTSYGAPAREAVTSRSSVVTRVTGWSTRPMQVRPGARTVFRVRLLSRVDRAGRPVVVQRRTPAGRWTTAARATTDRTGRARLVWVASTARTRVWLRVRGPRHGRALASTTRARLVTVTAGAPSDDDDPPVDPRVHKVLDLVNQARATGRSCGGQHYPAVRALRLDPRLDRAAGGYAHRMATEDFFDHTSPDGDDAGDRMSAAGYDWNAWGENIAAGQDTAAEVVDDWLTSAGHCRNIMGGSFEDIGVGVATDDGSAYGIYWVQVFGRQ